MPWSDPSKKLEYQRWYYHTKTKVLKKRKSKRLEHQASERRNLSKSYILRLLKSQGISPTDELIRGKKALVALKRRIRKGPEPIPNPEEDAWWEWNKKLPWFQWYTKGDFYEECVRGFHKNEESI